ncbi:MFS general substrate transporter [Exidia glandulosa HHB12029]|uniref:MFS general substrate transporter n=1 Tax=Exidia glandulosa HHB12029 TaxID=1314781 RepID=A0A166AB18_EXIGL|nr:MFS general substrate transporter [Exidia glandulosa HHB12029]
MEPAFDEEKAQRTDRASTDEQEQTPTGTLERAAAERALVRKIDLRVLPILCLMYFCSFIDRGNIGNARLQGLPEDVLHGDPTGQQFDWVVSVFYFTYIIVQIPATVASKLYTPRLWLGCCTIAWGIASTLMATAFNLAGLLVCRLFIGIFEAGFGPTVPLYMSFFYTKEELGLRMAYWFGFAAVSGAFSGLIAYGIQQVHSSVANWKLLFIIEGIPTVIIGIVAMLFLADRPESAHMFSAQEKELAVARMKRGTSKEVEGTLNASHIKLALLDWRIYVGGVIYFGMNVALASISAFLPTIIKTFGFSNADAQLLTVPPYAVAAIVLCSLSYVSDRLQSRGIVMACATFIGGIGYLILLTVHHNVGAQYFAVFLITAPTYTTIGLIIAWFAHNLGSETKRATGIPMFMAIGQCGSVLGSHIYPTTEGPRYTKGFGVSCAMQFAACISCIILTVHYRRENRRRDAKHGVPQKDGEVDTSVVADRAEMFRYLP